MAPLGAYAITFGSTARVHLFEVHELILGAQDLTETEQDFKLIRSPMGDAAQAVHEGRFLLPAGPLALLLANDRPVTEGMCCSNAGGTP